MNIIIGGEVDGINRKTEPEDGVNIIADTGWDNEDLEKIKKNIIGIEVYLRKKEDCPHNRGNWVIDFYDRSCFVKGIPIFSLKLPVTMAAEKVMKFVQPIIDILEEKKKASMN